MPGRPGMLCKHTAPIHSCRPAGESVCAGLGPCWVSWTSVSQNWGEPSGGAGSQHALVLHGCSRNKQSHENPSMYREG